MYECEKTTGEIDIENWKGARGRVKNLQEEKETNHAFFLISLFAVSVFWKKNHIILHVKLFFFLFC